MLTTDAQLPKDDFPVPLLRGYTVLAFTQLYGLDYSNLVFFPLTTKPNVFTFLFGKYQKEVQIGKKQTAVSNH